VEVGRERILSTADEPDAPPAHGDRRDQPTAPPYRDEHRMDDRHVAAIDNTTRKLMSEGRRPLSVGFWFSLGHSAVVLGLA
jgi:hypothetical protein